MRKKGIKLIIKQAILLLLVASFLLEPTLSVKAANSWLQGTELPPLNTFEGGSFALTNSGYNVFSSDAIPYSHNKIVETKEDGTYILEPIGGEDNEIFWLNSIIGRLFAAMGVGLETILGVGGVTLPSIIYGKAANTSINEANGLNTGDVFQYSLETGNPYGYISAVVYAVLRSIACLFLAVLVMASLAKAGVTVTGQDKSMMKEAIYTGFVVLAMLFFIPNIVDLIIYIKDLLLVTVSNGLPDGASMNIVGNMWLQFNLHPDTSHGIIYLNSVIFMFYLMYLYIGNAIAVACLFAFFPFVAVLSMKDKTVFMGWLKQMIGTIMTPLIDGILFICPGYIMSKGGESFITSLLALIACFFIVPARKAIKEALGLGGSSWGEAAGTGALKFLGTAAKGVAGFAASTAKGIKDAAHEAHEKNNESRAEEKEAAKDASLHEDMNKANHGIKDTDLSDKTDAMKIHGPEERSNNADADNFEGKLHNQFDEKGNPVDDKGLDKGGSLHQFDGTPSDKDKDGLEEDEKIHAPGGDMPNESAQENFDKLEPSQQEGDTAEPDMSQFDTDAGTGRTNEEAELGDEANRESEVAAATESSTTPIDEAAGGASGEDAMSRLSESDSETGSNEAGEAGKYDRIDDKGASEAASETASEDRPVDDAVGSAGGRAGETAEPLTGETDNDAGNVQSIDSAVQTGRALDAQELGDDNDRMANLQSIKANEDRIMEQEAKVNDLDNEAAFIKAKDDAVQARIDAEYGKKIASINERYNNNELPFNEAEKLKKRAKFEKDNAESLYKGDEKNGKGRYYDKDTGQTRSLAGINVEKQQSQGAISNLHNRVQSARELESKYAQMDKATGGTGEVYKSAEEMAMRQAQNDVKRAHANHKNFDSKEMAGVLSSGDKAKFLRERAAAARKERIKTDALFAGNAAKIAGREATAAAMGAVAGLGTMMLGEDMAIGAARAGANVGHAAWDTAETAAMVGVEAVSEIRHNTNADVRDAKQLGKAEARLTNARAKAKQLEAQRTILSNATTGISNTTVLAKNAVTNAGTERTISSARDAAVQLKDTAVDIGRNVGNVAAATVAHPVLSGKALVAEVSRSRGNNDIGDKMDKRMQEKISKQEEKLLEIQSEIESRREARGGQYNPTLNVSTPVTGMPSPTAREVRAYDPNRFRGIVSESREQTQASATHEHEIDKVIDQLSFEEEGINEQFMKDMDSKMDDVMKQHRSSNHEFKPISDEKVSQMSPDWYNYWAENAKKHNEMTRAQLGPVGSASKAWTDMSTKEREKAMADLINESDDWGDWDDYYEQ